MTEKQYIARYKKYMTAIGTYKEEFNDIIRHTAKLMLDYDRAEKDFMESGGEFIVDFTNKSGATNRMKNPHYLILEEIRRQLVSYHRELGLTPVGLKKINDKMKAEKKSKLDGVLALYGK